MAQHTKYIEMRIIDTYTIYPRCAQLNVTASGTGPSPDSSYLVAFPSAYSASNLGINFNIDAAPAMPPPRTWSPAHPCGPAPVPPPTSTTLKTVVAATSAASGGTTGCTVA